MFDAVIYIYIDISIDGLKDWSILFHQITSIIKLVWNKISAEGSSYWLAVDIILSTASIALSLLWNVDIVFFLNHFIYKYIHRVPKYYFWHFQHGEITQYNSLNIPN